MRERYSLAESKLKPLELILGTEKERMARTEHRKLVAQQSRSGRLGGGDRHRLRETGAVAHQLRNRQLIAAILSAGIAIGGIAATVLHSRRDALPDVQGKSMSSKPNNPTTNSSRVVESMETLPFGLLFVDQANYNPTDFSPDLVAAIQQMGIGQWEEPERQRTEGVIRESVPILKKLFGDPRIPTLRIVRGGEKPHLFISDGATRDSMLITRSGSQVSAHSIIVHELAHIMSGSAARSARFFAEGLATFGEEVVSLQTRNFVPETHWSEITYGERSRRLIGIEEGRSRSFTEFLPLQQVRYATAANFWKSCTAQELSDFIAETRNATDAISYDSEGLPIGQRSSQYGAWLREFILPHRDYPMLSVVRPEDVSELTIIYHSFSELRIVPVQRTVKNGIIVEKLRPCHNCFITFRNLRTGVERRGVPLPAQTIVMTYEQISELVGDGPVQAEYTEHDASEKTGVYDKIQFLNEPLELEDWQVQLLQQDPRMRLIEER